MRSFGLFESTFDNKKWTPTGNKHCNSQFCFLNMELSIIKGPRLVIALDIGSTYSGYAWQERSEFETNRSNIHFNTNWGAGALQLHKTTTCLYLEFPTNDTVEQADTVDHGPAPVVSRPPIGKDIIVKIGHEAERKYTGLAKQKQDPAELAGRFYFFRRFKLLLYNPSFHREIQIEDQIGQQLPFFDVMALFIKALKDHCLRKLDTTGVKYDPAKTLYVVTVPAIWSDEAKKFMRDAAEKAKIGKKNILLALEPEAAAIHCLHLPEEQRRNMNDLGMKGQKFLVADLGGGTADLSAVKVEESGLLSELLPPLGDPVGGQKINEAFLQVCHDSFEGQGWKETFSKATPVELLKMEADFEKSKVSVGSEDPDEEFIALEVPRLVKDKLEDKTIRLKPVQSVVFRDHEFMFNSDFVRSTLFQETCCVLYKTICKALKEEKAKDLKTVVLVGGFAESPIVVRTLREWIIRDFPHIKVVVPSSPFKAVLNGAVLFGHDPLIFRSRISRETYGIRTNVLYDPKVHEGTKKWPNTEDNKEYCKDIFDLHVKKEQSVVLNEKQPTKNYFPMYKSQKSLTLPIYTSTSLNPKYVTDDGCKKIGEVVVDMPDREIGTDRKVEVAMIYGGTELSVIAKDVTSGKEFSADIKFGNM